MIGYIVEVAAIVTECIFVSRFLILYFGYNSERLRYVKSAVLFSALVFIDCIGSFVLKNEIILMIGFFTSGAIFAVTCLKGYLFEKIAISAVSYILFYFVNLPVLAISSMLSNVSASEILEPSEQNTARIIGIFITKLLYFIFTQMILLIRQKDEHNFKLNEWIIIVSAFVITLTIGFSMYTLIAGDQFNEYIYVLIAVLLSLLDVIVFVFMQKMHIASRKESERELLQIQLVQQENEIQQLEHQYKQISILRHDHQNQLNCLYSLIHEKDYNGAESYLQSFIGNSRNAIKQYIQSSSSVLNAVINDKFSRAEEINIETSCRILTPIPKYLEYDLSIMLSNLLDNAIEACEKNKISSQIILIISDIAGYYRIAVKNTIQKSVIEHNKELKSIKYDKKLHGWGLKSVEEIVEKHLGTLNIYEKNGMFVVSALLTKREKSNMGAENVTLGAK